MWSSAIASSSAVLTPGRTAASTALMAPAVTSPDARMSSISGAVLTWIMRPLHFPSSGTRARIPVAIVASPLGLLALPGVVVPAGFRLAEGGHRAGRDLFHLTDGVDARQE